MTPSGNGFGEKIDRSEMDTSDGDLFFIILLPMGIASVLVAGCTGSWVLGILSLAGSTILAYLLSK